MKAHDFAVIGFVGAQDTFAVEIVSVDPVNAFFTCKRVDTGDQYTFQFSYTTGGWWQGTEDVSGNQVTIDRHDIYTPGGTDPVAQGVALVTFSDGSHVLCSVTAVATQTDLVVLDPPHPKLSFDLLTITASEWSAHPVGEQVASIEGYRLDNDLAPPAFTDGWWSAATRRDAFAGRIGGAIVPFAVVVHTTDMTPETWDSLLRNWTTELGDGSCANFAIGRDAAAGVVQLAPITKNGNHAGGVGHGSFVAGAQEWHPNSVSVGIELHCAGLVHKVGGAWRLVEGGAPTGAAIPDDDVIPDPDHAGRGWHRVTDYQYQQLRALLDGLETVLAPLPAGCVAHSIEQPPAYALFATGRRVGHVSLDAAHRGDPWPPTCDWMRALT